MQRIRFLKEVKVELDQIPRRAWGRIQKSPRESTSPRINTMTRQFEIPASAGMDHCFPVEAIVELPDAIAAVYLADGSAEINVSPQGSRITPPKEDGLI